MLGTQLNRFAVGKNELPHVCLRRQHLPLSFLDALPFISR